jgi:hypothetical protein
VNHLGTRSTSFRMSLTLILFVVACSMIGALEARAVVLSIHVSGNTLVDGNGQVVIPRGANRMGTEYQCIQNQGIFDGPSTVQTVLAMKSWTNLNMVRLPLNEDCWLGEKSWPGMNPAWVGASYQNAIETYVNLLTQNGVYTVLDLHWSASNGEGEFATEQQTMPNADNSSAFWTSVADRFKTNPAVVFDLFNEPFPDCNGQGQGETLAAWTTWRDGGTERLRVNNVCSQTTYQAVGMQDLVNTIRDTGATNVIMVSGIGWAGMMSQWLTYKPTDPLGQLVASHHRYRPPNHWCGTWSCWNAQLAPIAQQVPLITGEMGEDAQDVVCTHAFVDEYMTWADANKVGYLGWTWNVKPTYCLAMITSYENGTPTPYGQRYKSRFAPLFADNFDDGDHAGWTVAPSGYWSVVSGELKATGGTTGGWAWQYAGRALPSGVREFEARMATSATAVSNHGIVASTADLRYQVLVTVDQGNNLKWSKVTDGVWAGWFPLGTVDRTVLHTYTIRWDGGASFSVLLDGQIRRSGIIVDPPSVWGTGIAIGFVYTEADQAGQLLGTRYDDVVARP